MKSLTVIDEEFFAERLFNPRNDEWRPTEAEQSVYFPAEDIATIRSNAETPE
jgi:hypothetical protein